MIEFSVVQGVCFFHLKKEGTSDNYAENILFLVVFEWSYLPSPNYLKSAINVT